MAHTNEFGSKVITDCANNDIDSPVVGVDITVTVRLQLKAATVDCTGTMRSDLAAELRRAVEETLHDHLAYDIDGREHTDLVQVIDSIEVSLTSPITLTPEQ